MATDRVPIVMDPCGYLPPVGTFDCGVILEEVVTDNPSYGNTSLRQDAILSVVEPEERMTQPLTTGTYSSVVDNNCQLVPYEVSGWTNANFRPALDVTQPSLYENLYRSLLPTNQELMVMVGELRRERNSTEHRCNELNRMLEARDRDNTLYHVEIDRLVGLVM
ncbi:hypothetical protein Tco_0442791 [Tanacetum coccineum]